MIPQLPLDQCWLQLERHSELPPEQQPTSAVYASWLRCRQLMQPEQWLPPHCAIGTTLNAICQRKNDLLVLGQAALEDAYEYMDMRRCTLQILDESGCILWICGHPQTLAQLELLGIRDGAYWSEGRLGTNAPALAAIVGQPIRISATEHVKLALHPWNFCATPIHDNSGRQQGTIVLGCLAADGCASDLSLTLAIAREIGNSLNADNLLAETNRSLTQLYALLDGVENGVLAWDHRGYLQYLNQRAAEQLKLDKKLCQGRLLSELLTLPHVLTHAIQHRQALYHVEVTFENQQQFVSALITLKPIPDGDRCRFIALLHPIEKLRQFVSSQLSRVSQTFEQMPASSPEMRRLIRYGRLAAKGHQPILLQGEEGIGKELLAQAIHNASARAAGPYIALNCQALPEALMVRELLGCDASEGDVGQLSKFEVAHGGTLYLEQIEYLAPEMQSALLQILKTGVVMRINSSRVIPVDVRVIGASSAALPLLVKQNRFRRQLFYTLQAFSLDIPPLRQRQQDVPLLVHHHLYVLAQHFQCRYQIDEDALQQLSLYSWPGNDLELKSVVERAAMICQHSRIRLADLPDHLLDEHLLPEPDSSPLQPLHSLADLERQGIIRAAQLSQGQLQQMVQLLGIGRTTLWRKIRQYQLDISQFKTPS